MSRKIDYLIVNEIFEGLQGEGPLMGTPTTFIRLQGCNMNCSWCDTKKAQPVLLETQVSFGDIIKKLRYEYVCITGGEPLIQAREVGLFLKRHAKEYNITIFTNCSTPVPSWFSAVNLWICDSKTPSSGEESKYAAEWENELRIYDVMKYCISDFRDMAWVDRTTRFGNCIRGISPANYNSELVNSCITFCLEHDFRFMPQIHKIFNLR